MIELKYQKKDKNYKKLLQELEDEYEARYGQTPSEVDDDFFIDSFDYCQGNLPTLEQVQEMAELLFDRNK